MSVTQEKLIEPEAGGYIWELYVLITSSYINMILVLAIVYMLVKLVIGMMESDEPDYSSKASSSLPKMEKQDMTVEQLRKYDGLQGDGRVLIAINGKIFDVTKGKNFYGPGGPYSALAGHDASRALAMFQTDLVKEEYDDLSDLDSEQMESIRDWETQLSEKYDIVGNLIKPIEKPETETEAKTTKSIDTSKSVDNGHVKTSEKAEMANTDTFKPSNKAEENEIIIPTKISAKVEEEDDDSEWEKSKDD